MSERSELAKQVLSEIRELAEHPPYVDVDSQVVWVLSAPGTVYKKVSIPGDIYNGISADLSVVRWGIDLVRKITAARLEKNKSDITTTDIKNSGPILFYNGENENTEGKNYDQNDDFRRLILQQGFPLPESKIVIGTINRISTPSQVIGFAEFVRQNPDIKRVSVVSMLHHSVRVGRYLQHYKELFPSDLVFLNNPSPVIQRPVGMIYRETRKTIEYYERGHLAKNSYFQT